jgi:3'-phosphoadenosine 5'-phosphosulfate (PAPS) 3'-phosphatase
MLPRVLPHPVLGEEMTREEQDALWQDNPDGLWVVDPIDGTTNFVNGLPYFAISVALMVKGVSVLGVIYNPVSDEMFYARAAMVPGSMAVVCPQNHPQQHGRCDCRRRGEIPALGQAGRAHEQRGPVWQPAAWVPARWTGAFWLLAVTTFTCMAASGCGTMPPVR